MDKWYDSPFKTKLNSLTLMALALLRIVGHQKYEVLWISRTPTSSTGKDRNQNQFFASLKD